MDANQIFDFISKGGVAALMILILVGGSKEWWVYGVTYREMKQDRDDWRDMALAGTQLAESAVNHVGEFTHTASKPKRTTRVRKIQS